MMTALPDLPRLLEHCNGMRRDILVYSGLGEEALRDASTELAVDYEIWCSEYQGPDLADCFMGFGAMLRAWSFPWPDKDESSLNGFTIAQCYFGLAFSEIEYAIGIITGHSTTDGVICYGSMDDAAVAAIGAAKALTHAKHRLVSN